MRVLYNTPSLDNNLYSISIVNFGKKIAYSNLSDLHFLYGYTKYIHKISTEY